MRLGTKLIFAFLAVVLIPVGVILMLTTYTVESRFTEDFEQRLNGVAQGLQSDLDRIGLRIKDKLLALSKTEEIERIVVDMVRGTLERRALIRTASSWMQAWDLDFLTVLDSTGRILSCGHLPARFGSLDQDFRDLAQKQTLAPAIRTIQVSREGRIKSFLAVAVGARRQYGEAEVNLVGGRLLDQAFVEKLENLSGASVAIVDESDRLITHGGLRSTQLNLNPSAEVFQVRTDYSYREIPLGFSENPAVKARVVIGFARDKMEATLQQIWIGSMSAALVSVMVSFLLGIFLSKKITKPVQALVEGARRIATGDLDYRIERNDSSEIGELVRSFNSMVGDLATYQGKLVRAERVAAWQEIARRIAHEIMNPLSPIQVSIETLRKAYSKQHPAFSEIFEESTNAILEEVAALKRIVSEFSEFARLPKPTLVKQEINPIVDSVINLYRNAESHVEFAFRPGHDLPLVSVDKELMARVFSNILTNAIYAVGKSGKVRIETSLRQDSVLIEIADDGMGMTPQVLAKVFTPYFTSRQNGTGLGLAIAQRIVADHDGSIEINSQQDQGTKVLLCLPTSAG